MDEIFEQEYNAFVTRFIQQAQKLARYYEVPCAQFVSDLSLKLQEKNVASIVYDASFMLGDLESSLMFTVSDPAKGNEFDFQIYLFYAGGIWNLRTFKNFEDSLYDFIVMEDKDSCENDFEEYEVAWDDCDFAIIAKEMEQAVRVGLAVRNTPKMGVSGSSPPNPSL